MMGSPSTAASGIRAVSRARPASVTIMTRRRSHRSAYAPAGKPMTRSGIVSRIPTTPISSPEPVSSRTMSGSATIVMALPRAEIPWPSKTET